MIQLFGISLDTFASILAIIALVIVGGVLVLALGNRLFFKLGVRNIPRRRTQMVLIVFALMLSTTLLSAVLETGNVITSAVRSVAVFNLGSVDEVITGGRGGFFSESVYHQLIALKQQNPDIAAIGAALEEGDLLVADNTSRQVRSKVTGLGIIPDSEIGFGGMQRNGSNETLRISTLPPDTVYLNQTLAQLLNAHPGDTLSLYARRWPGKRFTLQVQDIVSDGGLVGGKPYLLTHVNTFRQIEQRPGTINHIYVANRSSGGVSSVDLSDQVTTTLYDWLPRRLHVEQVKAEGVENSEKAQAIFVRIFALFCLFSLAIGLLLIFLIFVLLAAERRAEMGMARAIGVKRRHLILMFIFEGAVYDLLASFVGLAIGAGLGALAVNVLKPTLARFGFPLALSFQPRDLVIALCLGVIFTFCAVFLSSWLVSRMTIVQALRNLPEEERSSLSTGDIVQRLAFLARQSVLAWRWRNFAEVRSILLEMIPDVLIHLVRLLFLLGLLPFLAGVWLFSYGLRNAQIIPFSLGLSLLIIGVGLFVKTCLERVLFWFGLRPQRLLYRLFATVVGLSILAYWALPFDVLADLGLPRFQGGIEVFFVAGAMMVISCIWVGMANAELLINPLLRLCSWQPGLYSLVRLATSYPLHHRLRTGLSILMFGLVIFAMTVMAIITNAMQNNYTDINVQTGGYDIQAVAYFSPVQDIRSELARRGVDPGAFSSIGVRTTTAAGIIQLDSQAPAWHLYPAQIIDGGFLQGYGLRLAARARGFDSDAAVWQALQNHPEYALIDQNTLSYPPGSSPVYDPNSPSADVPDTPPGFDPHFTFTMSNLYRGEQGFRPPSLWVTDQGLTKARKLTVIGVVDNSDGLHYGLYINRAIYGHVTVDNKTPEAQTYYFKVAPGQDKQALSLALGSAFLDHGLETTVLEDAVWQSRGPRIFISYVLIGMVGMVLVLGVAALAITGTRAVIERRQQIGMLRALGCKRRLLQGAFLGEALLVGCMGSIVGVVLGVILAYNIFAVDFFEQFNTGLVFVVPWDQLGLIVVLAFAASLLAALLPAWQAGRVPPVEALR